MFEILNSAASPQNLNQNLNILNGLKDLDTLIPPESLRTSENEAPYPSFYQGPHVSDLNPHQHVYVENTDNSTTITIVSTSLGEPYATSSRFSTGSWTATPQLYLLDPGWNFVVISTTQGSRYFQLQGTQIKTSHQAPSTAITARLIATQPIALRPTDTVPAPSAPPVLTALPTPAEPEADRGVNLEPAEIEQPHPAAGHHLHYSLAPSADLSDPPTDDPSDLSSVGKVNQFCTACGSSVHPQDRFCAYCGSALPAAHQAVKNASAPPHLIRNRHLKE